MIGLDTNILARYFTQDDATQSAQANRVIGLCSADNPGYISIIVLAELFWLLEKTYEYSRGQQVALLGSMLEVEDLQVESSDEVRLAAKAFSNHKGVQLADCLIGIRNAKAGCIITRTVDKAAGRLAEFELVR